MRILISGSSGLVGTELVSVLESEGHQVAKLVRRSSDSKKNEIFWDPMEGKLDKELLQRFSPEGVVHLAGENIAKGRWNEARKKIIRDSRVVGTQLLAKVISDLKDPPRVFVSASAQGFYGDRGEEILDEASPPGTGFLSDLCCDWEAATHQISDVRIRVVNLRIGMVLSQKGGALKKMLDPFRWGLGGVIGSGNQYTSWVTLDDLISIILMALQNEEIRGPLNAVSPNPVTNRVFTKTLGRVLGRPTLFFIPSFVARAAFGEMAEGLLLASSRVLPAKLEKLGFRFRFPDLEQALEYLLKK